jgi:putative toxin-antitoxin system antitoxin component (TIGR02293 family)
MESALKLLGILGSPSEIEVVDMLEKGLTKQNYQKAKDVTGFSHQNMASILSISTKTLESKKNKDRLSDTASERLLKLAELAAQGIQVFNSGDLFREWLQKPLRPLGGKKPVDLMVNMYGLDMVKNLLGRIEHGVYS